MPDEENVNQETGQETTPAAQSSSHVPGQGPVHHEDHGNEKAMVILASTMPWVISLLFHIGLFLVMFFVVFMVVKQQESEDIIVPDAVMSDNPGGVMNPRQTKTRTRNKSQTKRKKFRRKTKVSVDSGKTSKALSILSPGGSAGSASDMGMRTSGGGTKSSFFGSGGNAHNVVYVIDRSGSMSDTFDLVRQEILRSIGRLKAKQTFHIILFSTGDDLRENKPKRLVAADIKNKRQAARFMKTISPEGSPTNPIPALRKAFNVLAGAKKRGKLIYMLTDGDFFNNDKVVREIGRINKSKKVLINTFLFCVRAESAVNVLTTIARQNGGRFKFVSFDE